jgi:hypothetical protein
MPGGTGASVTLTGDQLAGILAANTRAAAAQPLPRDPAWSQVPFGPGQPLRLNPINQVRAVSQRPEPRLFELPISTNINLNTSPYVPWRILQDAADMPLFRKCIERRKGICALDFTVAVDPKAVARETAVTGQAKTDVESAIRQKYTADIARVTDWLEVPDRKNGQDWRMWTSALMENRLKYDATVVYPRLTVGGELFALEVIAGCTIKPLLDEYGGRPLPPFPAFQQILYGYPRGEFTATPDLDESGKPYAGPDGRPAVSGLTSDELLYERTIYRDQSPYGMSATEIALLDGIVWMRRMGWILAEYTEGVLPRSHIEVDGDRDWSVQQWEDWSRALNDHLGGNTQQRQKFELMPPGVHMLADAAVDAQYKPDYDMFLIKLVAGDFGMTATELGFPEVGSLGASFHEGEEDVLNRTTRIPDAQWVSKIATRLAVRHLGMPPDLQVKILGLESEDEAAADAVAQNQVQSARLTLNEDRARRGLPSLPFAEADMAMLMSDRGVVVLDGASKAAPPGVLLAPGTVKPMEPAEPGTGAQGGPAAAPAAGQAAPKQAPPQQKQAAKAEADAARAWLRKARVRTRPFECDVLTRADAYVLCPELLADDRIVFKDAAPKVLAGTGPAGSGTGSW